MSNITVNQERLKRLFLKVPLWLEQEQKVMKWNEKLNSERNDINYKKYHAYAWALAPIDWAIFGSLTWKNPNRRTNSWQSEELRRADFAKLLAYARQKFKLRDFALYRTMEYGAGENHYHFLMARKGVEKVNPAEFAASLNDAWTGKTCLPATGTADIRPYDQAQGLAGLEYCLKREFDSTGAERERFDYVSKSLRNLALNQNN